MNDWSYTFTPPKGLQGMYREWMLFSSCGLNVWLNVLCYILSISSLNLFKFHLCLSSTQAPFQQQSNIAEGYLSYPSQYYIEFSPLDACHSTLMMKTRGCLCNIGTYAAEKTGFYTRRHTHTFTAVYRKTQYLEKQRILSYTALQSLLYSAHLS